MFRMLTPIIRSSYSCNYSFWHWSTASITIRTRERMVVVVVVVVVVPGWPVPEAVIAVLRAPDDGCQHPKHVELSREM